MGLKINIEEVEMKEHPKTKGVKIGFIVTKEKCREASIIVLEVTPGVEIPIHTHEKEVDTVYVIQGEGEIFINGKWEKIGSGDIMVMFPGEEHGLRCKGDKIMRCFIVHAPALW